MKNYVIVKPIDPQTGKRQYAYHNLYYVYQRELDNRIDSLLDYQSWVYPFFRLINNTQQDEVVPFLPLREPSESTPSDEDLLNQFPTNNSTLTEYKYMYPATVLTEPNKHIQIVFINNFNKHQGFTVYDENIFIAFKNLDEFRLIPGINFIADHFTITEKTWNQIFYKPSIITTINLFLRAKASENDKYDSSAVTVLNFGKRFATFPTDQTHVNNEYQNFITLSVETKQSDTDDDFRRNSKASMGEMFLVFKDQNNNVLMPTVANDILLWEAPIGMVIFSNTFYHDIDFSLKKATLFHLSNFTAPIWTIANGSMKIVLLDNANMDYGYNIILPAITHQMRYITQTTMSPTSYSIGIDSYALYTKNGVQKKYQRASEPIIVQPEILVNDNIRETVIGDFKYTQSVSKIDNTTKYHYTITNESGTRQIIYFTTI